MTVGDSDFDTESLSARGQDATPRCAADSEESQGEVEESIAGAEEVHHEDEEEELEEVGEIPRGVALRMALVTLDEVNPRIVFRQRQ